MRYRLPFFSIDSKEVSMEFVELNAIDQSTYKVSDRDNDVAAIEEFVRKDERS